MIFTGPITPVLSGVDAWNADVLANAVKFSAALFQGRGKYETIDAATKDEIIEAAVLLKEQFPENKRDVIVYAFDAAGNRTILSGTPYKEPKAKAPKAKKGLAVLEAIGRGDLDAPAKARKAKAEKPAKAPKPEKPLGKRAEIAAAAERGVLPDAPDFSADTHKPFRKKLEQLVALVKAADIEGLEAFEIKPISSSRKAMDRYRNLSVVALKAKAAKKAAKAEKPAVAAPEAE